MPVRLDAVEFASVNVTGILARPIAIVPNETLEGVSVTVPADVPVPVSGDC